MQNNTEHISPYIKNIMDWKIREIIKGYLEAYTIFTEKYHSTSNRNKITFSDLRKICDILYDAKENYHLLFKKVLHPKKQIFETANKITPNSREIKFINNVGVLFHRIMVARELKYIIDYYKEDSDWYEESKISLATNLRKINKLFADGLEIFIANLNNYTDNVLLVTYFLENRKLIEKIFQNKIEKFISLMDQNRSIEEIYLSVAKYYLESGWIVKAKGILKFIIKKCPKHKEAVKILKSMNQ